MEQKKARPRLTTEELFGKAAEQGIISTEESMSSIAKLRQLKAEARKIFSSVNGTIVDDKGTKFVLADIVLYGKLADKESKRAIREQKLSELTQQLEELVVKTSKEKDATARQALESRKREILNQIASL